MDLTPIIVFTNFKDISSDFRYNNAYPISLLRNELKNLLDDGYSFISLSQIIDDKTSLPQKRCCLTFVGGYVENYSLAFPLLQEYGIHADIFIPGDLVGCDEYPGLPNFIPHFSWQQANEMKKSGIIDIYPMWHPFDEGKCLNTTISEKIRQISDNISDSLPIKSFWMSINHNEQEKVTALKEAGVSSYLIPVLSTTLERLENKALPYMEVSPDKGILTAIDYFNEVSQSIIRREESIRNSENRVFNWNNNKYSSVSLPVEMKPIVRNYLRHAIPLSILEAERKDIAELWVLNEYIDVVFRPWYHWYDYDNQLYDSWNVLICNSLYRDFVEVNNINIVDSLLNGLNGGYYADVWLDSYYIPGKPAYNNMHLAHNVLIYSYDQSANLFNALSYSVNGRYERIGIKPSNILKACSNEYFIRVNFLKRNKETSIAYNIDHLFEKLKRYIESEYNSCGYSKYTSYDKNQFINYNASLAFPKYILTTAEQENKIYIVALYSFLEHKKIMAWRLNYIAKREYISHTFFNEYENYTRKITEKILALGLKFQTSKNKSILPKICTQLEELNEKEKEAIGFLLQLTYYKKH